MKAVVVGTGVGSLASALRLRKLGFQVEVIETCPDPGGRARTFNIHGENFDAGPTVITAPWLFDELFQLFGENRSDRVEFLPCDPWYRVSYADGTSFDITTTFEAQKKEIARLSATDAAQYQAFFGHAEELYKVGYEQLGAADFSAPLSMIKALPKLMRLGGFRSLWAHTGKYFQDPRIRQAFSLQTLLVGGNPLRTTAIYGLIHAMERKGGIWFAKGGTGKLIEELVKLAERNGITFRFNSELVGINSSESKLSQVEVKEGKSKISIDCDLCVWGGDPVKAYELLSKSRLSWSERMRLSTIQSSMGLYVLYFKTAKRFPDVAHHTIILSSRWEGLLKDIFSGKKLPQDPSLYLHRPAATDPTFQREDGELFYVLAPVPHLGNFNSWQDSVADFKDLILGALDESVLPGVNAHLIFAESVDPRYFRDQLKSHQGAGFSIAPLLEQSAWFRFHNRSDKVKNLYLCGAGVHPGGGLPGVATSAKVIEQMIMKDFGLRVNSNRQQDIELKAWA
jgi:phytoene desaturase